MRNTANGRVKSLCDNFTIFSCVFIRKPLDKQPERPYNYKCQGDERNPEHKYRETGKEGKDGTDLVAETDRRSEG